MNKKIKSTLILIISIPIIIFSISISMQSSSNLAQLEEEKQKSLPVFEESFGLSLQICDPDKRMSEKELQRCKEDMKFQQEQCNFYGNPDFCYDPRIDKIMKKKFTPNTETSDLPEVKNPSQVEMKTYTNSKYDFSIDYPAHWSPKESTFRNTVVNFEDMDETKFGMPGFWIEQDENDLATPLESLQFYFDQFDPKFTTNTIESQNQMTINGIDTLKVTFRTIIDAPSVVGDTTFFYATAFIYDTPKGNMIFYYSAYDNPRYSDFIQIFERVAQTFKITQV